MEQKTAFVYTFGETAYRIGLQLRAQGHKGMTIKNFMHSKDKLDENFIITENEEVFQKVITQTLMTEGKTKSWCANLWRILTSRRECDERKLVIVAGLGGDYSSQYAPMAARVAASMGYQVVSVVQLPFKFEGVRRRRRAETALNQLQHYSQRQFVIDHSDLSKKNENMSLSEYFQIIDNMMLQAICEEM